MDTEWRHREVDLIKLSVSVCGTPGNPASAALVEQHEAQFETGPLSSRGHVRCPGMNHELAALLVV